MKLDNQTAKDLIRSVDQLTNAIEQLGITSAIEQLEPHLMELALNGRENSAALCEHLRDIERSIDDLVEKE